MHRWWPCLPTRRSCALLTYLPSYLLTYLLTYLPTYLPTYLLRWWPCLRTRRSCARGRTLTPCTCCRRDRRSSHSEGSRYTHVHAHAHAHTAGTYAHAYSGSAHACSIRISMIDCARHILCICTACMRMHCSTYAYGMHTPRSTEVEPAILRILRPGAHLLTCSLTHLLTYLLT